MSYQIIRPKHQLISINTNVLACQGVVWNGVENEARLRSELRRGIFLAIAARATMAKKMVEAVGIEPTSEELRSPVSPCAAGD